VAERGLTTPGYRPDWRGVAGARGGMCWERAAYSPGTAFTLAEIFREPESRRGVLLARLLGLATTPRADAIVARCPGLAPVGRRASGSACHTSASSSASMPAAKMPASKMRL
jgi:hypothetical protein